MKDTTEFRRKLTRVDLERMNLPEDYWTSKVAGVARSVRATINRYLTNFDEMFAKGAGLLVTGPSGVGKTAISALVAKEARCRGYTVFFARIWELREMVRTRVWYDDDALIAQRVRDVDVLILDDLSADDATEKFYSLTELRELVQYRASRRRLTVVTTAEANLTTGPLAVFSEATVGSLVMFPVKGPNLYERKEEELQQVVHGG